MFKKSKYFPFVHEVKHSNPLILCFYKHLEASPQKLLTRGCVPSLALNLIWVEFFKIRNSISIGHPKKGNVH